MTLPEDSPAGTPSFCMLELGVYGDKIQYVFMNNCKRFFVDIDAEHLKGPGSLLEEFQEFAADLDDPGQFNQFEDWIFASLDEFLLRVAPPPKPGSRTPITLLDYFNPETYALELVNKDGKLEALLQIYDPAWHGNTSPRTRIVEAASDTRLPTAQASESVVSSSSLPSVPRFLASQLQRVDDELEDRDLSEIPRKVRHVITNETFFFKPGFKDHGHIREMEIFSQIQHDSALASTVSTSSGESRVRTSKLAGLVMWDDDSEGSLLGLLIGYIEGKTLQWHLDDEEFADGQEIPQETKLRWMAQVESTVRQLHSSGIVWGDVKPDNVMIDTEGDAVVIDFGGGYTPEYIPPELQQTAQGDLVGLGHMREMLGLPSGPDKLMDE
ncbi:hypothetical protein F4808DRAFT_363564 [Astrocystis sublimbata]|nr:hypothetical protein F4808DRAFT_363564 [Astrocystis sublimbata]